MSSTQDNIIAILKELSQRHRGKEGLMEMYIDQRLDMTLNTYYESLYETVLSLITFRGLSVLKRYIRS